MVVIFFCCRLVEGDSIIQRGGGGGVIKAAQWRKEWTNPSTWMVKIQTLLQQEDVNTLALTFLPPMGTVWLLVAFLISSILLVPRSHNTPRELRAAPLRVVASAASRTLLTWLNKINSQTLQTLHFTSKMPCKNAWFDSYLHRIYPSFHTMTTRNMDI